MLLPTPDSLFKEGRVLRPHPSWTPNFCVCPPVSPLAPVTISPKIQTQSSPKQAKVKKKGSKETKKKQSFFCLLPQSSRRLTASV